LRPQVLLRPLFIEIGLAVLEVGTVVALGRFERIQQYEAFAVLRITNDEGSQALTLRLEGRLEGPWVAGGA